MHSKIFKRVDLWRRVSDTFLSYRHPVLDVIVFSKDKSRRLFERIKGQTEVRRTLHETSHCKICSLRLFGEQKGEDELNLICLPCDQQTVELAVEATLCYCLLKLLFAARQQ